MAELPLVTIKIFHEGLGIQEITAFNAYSYDKQEKLLKLINACKDKSAFLLTAKEQGEVIFKLTEGNYAINYDQNRVTFYMPAEDNKQKVRIVAPLTDQLLEKLANCNGLTYLRVKLDGLIKAKGNTIIAKAKKVTFYRADYDLETAKDLLKEHKPIDLLMLALGYKPTPEAIAVTLPRLLTLFKYFDSYKITGIHVASFQQKGTGKTTTFNMLENLANAYYCEKIPTEAKLIGDARLGTYGIVKRADIIAIDEFEKTASTEKDNFALIFPILLTGMEQGVFKREVSSKRDLEVRKAISFCFMGNSEHTIKDMSLNKFGIASKISAIELLKNLLKASIEKNANISAFLDRLVYVEFLRERYQIRKDLNLNDEGLTQFLHPKVARGIIKLLRDEFLKSFSVGYAENRTDRSVKVLAALLKLLGLEELAEDHGVIEDLVAGKVTFWDCLVTQKRNSSSISSTELDNKPDKAKEESKPKEEATEPEELDFSIESALGYGKVDSLDLLDDKREVNNGNSSNFSEQTEDRSDCLYRIECKGVVGCYHWEVYKAEINPAECNKCRFYVKSVTVRFVKHCPEFVGVDGLAHGPFKPGEIAKIPAANAKPLLDGGYAVIVR